MAASEVASFKMNFIRQAGTLKPETLVSEKAEYTLAIYLLKTKKKAFWSELLL